MNPARYAFYRWVLRSFSQLGQDRWALDVHNNKRGGYFVEFGAYDGITISNTYMLEKFYGWTGLLIEPNPRYYKKAVQCRNSPVVNCAVGKPGLAVMTDNDVTSTSHIMPPNVIVPVALDTLVVPQFALDTIFETMDVPKHIDFMSVDVEDGEDDALLDFPFEKWNIGCTCVERPSTALIARMDKAGLELVGQIPSMDGFFVNRNVPGLKRSWQELPWTWRDHLCNGIVRLVEWR